MNTNKKATHILLTGFHNGLTLKQAIKKTEEITGAKPDELTIQRAQKIILLDTDQEWR